MLIIDECSFRGLQRRSDLAKSPLTHRRNRTRCFFATIKTICRLWSEGADGGGAKIPLIILPLFRCKLVAYMDSSDKHRVTAQQMSVRNWACNPSHSKNKCLIFLPLILTVGELGPADCFLHPLQFWHRLSASEMKEHRESSSNLSESSKENLSPSSHSANISSMTSTCKFSADVHGQ